LNFLCKYVVSGLFPFQLFFLICSFSILKTENEREKWAAFKAEETGSEKPENKKQKYRIAKS
jgi:hypothetical protein